MSPLFPFRGVRTSRLSMPFTLPRPFRIRLPCQLSLTYLEGTDALSAATSQPRAQLQADCEYPYGPTQSTTG
jgi:hypothetical protein